MQLSQATKRAKTSPTVSAPTSPADHVGEDADGENADNDPDVEGSDVELDIEGDADADDEAGGEAADEAGDGAADAAEAAEAPPTVAWEMDEEELAQRQMFTGGPSRAPASASVACARCLGRSHGVLLILLRRAGLDAANEEEEDVFAEMDEDFDLAIDEDKDDSGARLIPAPPSVRAPVALRSAARCGDGTLA